MEATNPSSSDPLRGGGGGWGVRTRGFSSIKKRLRTPEPCAAPTTHVHPLSASKEDLVDLLCQPGKICGEDAGGDARPQAPHIGPRQQRRGLRGGDRWPRVGGCGGRRAVDGLQLRVKLLVHGIVLGVLPVPLRIWQHHPAVEAVRGSGGMSDSRGAGRAICSQSAPRVPCVWGGACAFATALSKQKTPTSRKRITRMSIQCGPGELGMQVGRQASKQRQSPHPPQPQHSRAQPDHCGHRGLERGVQSCCHRRQHRGPQNRGIAHGRQLQRQVADVSMDLQPEGAAGGAAGDAQLGGRVAGCPHAFQHTLGAIADSLQEGTEDVAPAVLQGEPSNSATAAHSDDPIGQTTGQGTHPGRRSGAVALAPLREARAQQG